MPIEEATKKKHRLFSLKILRKRSDKGKGKSKSLVDLYGSKDGQGDEKRNSMVERKNRLSQSFGLSSHGGGNVDVSVEEKMLTSPVGENDLHLSDSYAIDNDEVDGRLGEECPGTGNMDGREVGAEDETQEDQELPDEEVDVTEQPSFPPGTSVCIKYVLCHLDLNVLNNSAEYIFFELS